MADIIPAAAVAACPNLEAIEKNKWTSQKWIAFVLLEIAAALLNVFGKLEGPTWAEFAGTLYFCFIGGNVGEKWSLKTNGRS